MLVKLYSIPLSTFYNDYNEITDEEKENTSKKYFISNLFIKGQRFIEDGDLSKSQLEEIIAETVKLRRQKEKMK